MRGPLVSIIIPVYNVSEYLCKCLESVVSQTYDNLEIILVDDGSTDDSGEICDQYGRNDPRIHVLHQKNSGQAHARNRAFQESHGEYILYVDSDDFIARNHVEVLMSAAMQYDADIVQCFMKKFKGKNPSSEEKNSIVAEEVFTSSGALEEFCYQRKFYACPWCKVIRREIMEQISFPENTGYEDLAIMFYVLGKAEKIVLVPEIMYYYRQHSASTMHTGFSDRKVDRIRIADCLKSYIQENYPELNQAVQSRFLLANLQLVMDLPWDREYRDLWRKVWENIVSTRKAVLHDKKAKKSLRIMAAASFFGRNTTKFLGRMYKRFS